MNRYGYQQKKKRAQYALQREKSKKADEQSPSKISRLERTKQRISETLRASKKVVRFNNKVKTK